jgi:methylmalonyl-CoA mutase
MLTRRDAYVNMLRATMATFSAGLAGANSINVLPHTLALGLPDPFARRVARNTQLVLLEESNLAKVSDPAAGSGGIEALTSALCEAAWQLFQETEKAGGVFAGLEQNLIQRRVAATRAAREANIARRKEVLTGASEFPNLHETQVAVLNAKPVELAPYGEAKFKFDALPPMRLAVPFERLRDRSDEILKARGARPKVFLANLGTPADFTARATFAKSFFEVGGIEAVDTDGFADPAALAKAFKHPARRWFACAPRTRSMPRRPPPPRRLFKPPGQDISIWQGGRASRKPCFAPPASTISSLPAAMCWPRCRKPIAWWSEHDDGS